MRVRIALLPLSSPFVTSKLLDGTMARMAELMGLRITDYDTAGMGS